MLRQKSMIFWSLAFPLILGMLFYFMFGGIEDLEQFQKVPAVFPTKKAKATTPQCIRSAATAYFDSNLTSKHTYSLSLFSI